MGKKSLAFKPSSGELGPGAYELRYTNMILALRSGVPLVTDDAQLRAVFPHVAISPEAFLGGRGQP